MKSLTPEIRRKTHNLLTDGEGKPIRQPAKAGRLNKAAAKSASAKADQAENRAERPVSAPHSCKGNAERLPI